MTPKTLFNIVLKVFGLFFLKDIFFVVIQLLPTVTYVIRPDMESQGLIQIALFSIYLLIYGLVAFYLIIKTDLVIDKLKLDQDFDQEPFQFNMHRSTVLSIALIVIGGLIIIEGIPTLLRELGTYYQQSRDNYRKKDPSFIYIIVSVSKVLIGFLIIIEKKWIVNFIEKKRKD
jgi:uncharacterized membrane protein YidH (DUF202 family)